MPSRNMVNLKDVFLRSSFRSSLLCLFQFPADHLSQSFFSFFVLDSSNGDFSVMAFELHHLLSSSADSESSQREHPRIHSCILPLSLILLEYVKIYKPDAISYMTVEPEHLYHAVLSFWPQYHFHPHPFRMLYVVHLSHFFFLSLRFKQLQTLHTKLSKAGFEQLVSGITVPDWPIYYKNTLRHRLERGVLY